ncbi:MAG: hypothetical protein OHK0022_60200 [Roseiflexaceae bacterium]
MILTSTLPYAVAFAQLVIGLVFALSAVGKLRNIRQFARTITAFQVFPSYLSMPFAVIMLLSEIAVVVLVLMGGNLLISGFLLAALLLTAFALALASALVRRIQTSCNCFGTTTKPISSLDLWRNGGLVVCALLGAGAANLPASQAALGPIEWAVLALAAVLFLSIWLQLDQLARLFSVR